MITNLEIEKVVEKVRKNPRRIAQILATNYDDVIAYQFISIIRERLAVRGKWDVLRCFNEELALQEYRG